MSSLDFLADAASLLFATTQTVSTAGNGNTDNDGKVSAESKIDPISTESGDDSDRKAKRNQGTSSKENKAGKVKSSDKTTASSSTSINSINALSPSEKVMKRREQIAAASRKSRERRKQEFVHLRNENSLLWEYIDQLNNQLLRVSGTSLCNEHLSSMRSKRTNDELAQQSSDEEESLNDGINIINNQSKRQKTKNEFGLENSDATINHAIPSLLPQTPSSISLESVGSSCINSLSTTACLPLSSFTESFHLPMDIHNSSTSPLLTIGATSLIAANSNSHIDMQKLHPLITLSEKRTDWFVQHFKADLISTFNDILSNEERMLLTNIKVKLTR